MNLVIFIKGKKTQRKIRKKERKKKYNKELDPMPDLTIYQDRLAHLVLFIFLIRRENAAIYFYFYFEKCPTLVFFIIIMKGVDNMYFLRKKRCDRK